MRLGVNDQMVRQDTQGAGESLVECVKRTRQVDKV